jgi:hypothetical protein
MPAPVVNPCITRQKTNCPMLFESAQPADAKANKASPHSTTGLRPRASDKAP